MKREFQELQNPQPENPDPRNGTSGPSNATPADSPFRDCPFYCGGTIPTLCESLDSVGRLCFNHLVGFPQKDGISHPLWDYEQQVFDTWKNHKHIWILKSTGLGISEFFLRLMLWLALRNDQYHGCQFCIVVGPNIDLAKKLIKRMTNILQDFTFSYDVRGYQHAVNQLNMGTETQISIEVNNVLIQAFPSNHLESYRSLDKPKFIFVDEADFFKPSEQPEVRDVSERYIGKSQPWIILVSTPDKPDGLMATIEKEDPSIYHKMKLGYEVGLGKIYSHEQIAIAKMSPSFEREYNLKYLGKVGNVFSQVMIANAVTLGELYKSNEIVQGAAHFGGIDPGFSKTTPVYIGELDIEHQVLRIVYCKRFELAIPTEIVEEVWQLHKRYLNLKWFVDASNKGFINELKFAFGENIRWNKPEEVSHRSNHIIPVNFGSHQHEHLLEHLHSLISKGKVAIPKEYEFLITSLHTANAIEWDLDKDETVYDDDLDCLRLITKEVKIA